MNLKSVEAFYWVVTLASFRRAAAKLHTTQPAISQRIASLESELGIKVLDRSSRTIKPTGRGRVLFEYAERLLGLHSEMIMKVSEEKSISGVLRLGLAETIVHTWLMDFLRSTKEKYPDLLIDIMVDITPTLRSALRAGELDMAFVLGPQLDDDFVECELCKYDLQFYAAPSLQIGNRSLAVPELCNYTIITFPKRTYPYTALKHDLTRFGRRSPQIITNYSLSTIVKMAEQGFGICVVPRLAVINEVSQGTLQVCQTELKLQDLSFSVAYSRGSDDATKEAIATLAVATARAANRGVHSAER